MQATYLKQRSGAPPPEAAKNKSVGSSRDVELVEKAKRASRSVVEDPPKRSKGTAMPNSQGKIPFVEVTTRRAVEEHKAPKKKHRVTIADETDEDEAEEVEQTPAKRAEAERLPLVDRREPAFTRRAPVEDPDTMKRVGKELLDLAIPIVVKDLASVSPEAREYLRKLFTRKRVPREEGEPTLEGESRLVHYIESLHPSEEERFVSALDLFVEEDLALEQQTLTKLPNASCYYTTGEGGLPVGSLVVEDPVEIYLNSLEDDQPRRPIIVSRESQSLTCIYPVFNGAGIEEALLDGGSQICSMSEESARRLNVSWDPTITIYLQSANASTAKTLGLARNVLMNVSGINAYVQLHVVPKTAYKVLLGRPFDVLMATTIHNKRSGEQLITVHDPNTDRALTIPTFPRGKPPPNVKQRLEEERREYHFRTSMS